MRLNVVCYKSSKFDYIRHHSQIHHIQKHSVFEHYCEIVYFCPTLNIWNSVRLSISDNTIQEGSVSHWSGILHLFLSNMTVMNICGCSWLPDTFKEDAVHCWLFGGNFLPMLSMWRLHCQNQFGINTTTGLNTLQDMWIHQYWSIIVKYCTFTPPYYTTISTNIRWLWW